MEEVPYEEILSIRKEVLYSGKNQDFAILPDDNRALHMGIVENSETIAIVSLFLYGHDLQFRKLAIKEKYQNKGYGTKILKWIFNYANDVKLEKIWCNARIEKKGFYEKCGLMQNGDVFEKNGIKYVIMEKISDQAK